jgi:hypothetical protein
VQRLGNGRGVDPKSDPAVANIKRRIKPQHRLKAVWAIASKKRVC